VRFVCLCGAILHPRERMECLCLPLCTAHEETSGNGHSLESYPKDETQVKHTRKRKPEEPQEENGHFQKRLKEEEVDQLLNTVEELRTEIQLLRREKEEWKSREDKLRHEIENLQKVNKLALDRSPGSNFMPFGEILELPRDVVLYRIFSYLRTERDQLRLRQVCKKWKSLIEGWIPKLDCESYHDFFTDHAMKGLSNCTNLQILNMTNCRRLTHHSFEYITQLTSLTELSIPNNMLGWPPKDNAVLQLSRLTNLKTLRIPQTNLKDLDNLTRLNNLQTLDLT